MPPTGAVYNRTEDIAPGSSWCRAGTCVCACTAKAGGAGGCFHSGLVGPPHTFPKLLCIPEPAPGALQLRRLGGCWCIDLEGWQKCFENQFLSQKSPGKSIFPQCDLPLSVPPFELTLVDLPRLLGSGLVLAMLLLHRPLCCHCFIPLAKLV